MSPKPVVSKKYNGKHTQTTHISLNFPVVTLKERRKIKKETDTINFNNIFLFT